MQMKLFGFLLLIFLSFNIVAEEEILLLKAILAEPPNSTQGLPRPKQGMTMENVKKIFGEPEAVTESVGKPPISQWIYAGYVVYFQDKYVVNTVMKKPIGKQEN